jgi:hypothetical protein
MSYYRNFEIEIFEVQWHARFRRKDSGPTIIDGLEFDSVHVGFAWTNEADDNEARSYIDNMRAATSHE